MTQQTKAELLEHHRKDYMRASKKDKGQIIDFLVISTGYTRKHLIHALNKDIDIPKKITRNRISQYSTITGHLKKLWAFSNFLCGKRLKPFLPELLSSLVRHEEIQVSKEDESLLLIISAATIDRILAPTKKALLIKGRSTTKPGTLLKHKIAVRTANEWNDNRAGFFEIDLVAHCGEATRGEYINTLDITDIATGWTVCVPFMGRSERFCIEAIKQAKESLPFPMLGIDSDNDSAFINDHLRRYCMRNNLAFTRSRPYKKNDQCRIEQKNWDVVRKTVGYGRFDSIEQLQLLKRIYNLLALYQNYFQPSQKATAKIRIGAKVRKSYDVAQTPCQRLLSNNDVSDEAKRRLLATLYGLNPAELLRSIQSLVSDLCDL